MSPRTKIVGEYSYQGGKKRSLSNFVRGVTGFILVLVLTSSVTTQYMAGTMHNASGLGAPWFTLHGNSYYYPYQAYKWVGLLLKHGGFTMFPLSCILFLGLGWMGSLAILVGNLFFGDKGTLSNVHGSARWAGKKDIIEAGLLPRTGTTPTEISVYVGGWQEIIKRFFFWETRRLCYLIHGGPEHILAFAPTRAGKGVGLVIPTLLRWADSVLVYDIKGENFALTSGWRSKELGSVVIRLDPTDPKAFEEGTSGTFNPLEEIPLDYAFPKVMDDKIRDRRVGEYPPLEQVGSGETAAIQNLVSMIVDPEGKGLEDHWSKTSHSLLVGCITHLLYVGLWKGQTPCLGDVATELSKPGSPWKETIEKWQKFHHLGEKNDPDPERRANVHPVVNVSAQEMLNREEKEASSVLSTAISFLTLYRDPVIARNTSRSTFKISDLMRYDRPVSLYFVVKPVDKDRIRPFVRLFITQVIRRLADSMKFENGEQVKDYKHRLLLMLDEFPSLGRLQIFEEALAFIAGYGMKAYLIIQDIAQLHKIYGKDEAITGNCHVKIAYATSNPDTAKYLSETSGITTIIKESESVSGDRFAPFKKNVSVSVQEISRPLLTVDECMRLKGPEKDSKGMILVPGDMLIFVAGYAGIYGKQLLFFKDKELSRRAKLPESGISGQTYNPDLSPIDLATKVERLVGENVLATSDPDAVQIDMLRELVESGALLEINGVSLNEETDENTQQNEIENSPSWDVDPDEEEEREMFRNESESNESHVPTVNLEALPGAEHVKDTIEKYVLEPSEVAQKQKEIKEMKEKEEKSEKQEETEGQIKEEERQQQENKVEEEELESLDVIYNHTRKEIENNFFRGFGDTPIQIPNDESVKMLCLSLFDTINNTRKDTTDLSEKTHMLDCLQYMLKSESGALVGIAGVSIPTDESVRTTIHTFFVAARQQLFGL
jgi:type IV secretion system protein VirD4